MKTIQVLLQQLETTNDILSKFQLGYLYDKGELVTKDDAKAFQYYQQASEMEVRDQNSLDMKYKSLAIYNVGVMYFYGRGVQENKQLALELVQKAAEFGVAEANWRLGQMYQLGEGVAQNNEKAYKHYLLAANQGHADAQFNLGKMYFEGFQAKIECELYLMLSSTFDRQYSNNLDKIKDTLPLVIFDQDKRPVRLFILNTEGDPQKVELLSNNCPMGLLEQFIYEYRSSGHGFLKQNSPILDWLTTSRVGHTTKNLGEARKWFKKAEEGGHSQAKYFLNEDWLISIWPRENGTIYSFENNCFGYDSIRKTIDLCKKLLLDNQELSFERDIGDDGYCYGKYISKNIKNWITMVAIRNNIFEGFYAAGSHYLSKIKGWGRIDSRTGHCARIMEGDRDAMMEEARENEHKIQWKVGYKLEPESMTWERFRDAESGVKELENHIDLYALAKANFTSALKGGVKKATERLQYLERRHGSLMSKFGSILSRYNLRYQNALNEHVVLNEITDLFEANKLYEKKQQLRQFTIPCEYIHPLLSKCIKNSNIYEYMAWTSCVLDENVLQDINKSTLNSVIELKKWDTVKQLLSLETININYVIENLNMSPLEAIIEQGDAVTVKTLLERPDVDVNFNKPLLKAIETEQKDIITLLLKHTQIDINASQLSGSQNLFLNKAIELKKWDTVKQLLSLETININYVIENLNMSPLEAIIEQGDAVTVKTLLERPDVDVNLHNPLFKAIEKNNKEIITLLLAHPKIGINIVKTPGAQNLSLNRAIELKQWNVVKQLLSVETMYINYVIPKLNMTPLELMIEQGDVSTVEALLKQKDLDVNLNYPLFKAIIEGKLDIVMLLLERSDIDINIIKELGSPSPLWLAAKYGYSDIVQELLSHPNIYVDYQCSQLSTYEEDKIKSTSRKKINAQEVANIYGHTEIIKLIQDYKDLRRSQRVAQKRQRESVTELNVDSSANIISIGSCSNSGSTSSAPSVGGSLFYSKYNAAPSTTFPNQSTNVDDIDEDVVEVDSKRRESSPSLRTNY
ncbi:MAG: ankyrin repeat domain-containing protein [Gammaproteobacteria bacterium]